METMLGETATWNEYVDMLMVGSGVITKAAIFGLNKNHELTEWASTEGFVVNVQEGAALFKAFIDSAEIRSNGMVLNDEKFTCIRTDSDLLVGRTAEGGCVVGRTKQVMVIGVFDDPFQANCWNMVLKLSSFLRDHGF